MGIQELCNHELATYPLGSDVIGLAEAILDLIRAD